MNEDGKPASPRERPDWVGLAQEANDYEALFEALLTTCQEDVARANEVTGRNYRLDRSIPDRFVVVRIQFSGMQQPWVVFDLQDDCIMVGNDDSIGGVFRVGLEANPVADQLLVVVRDAETGHVEQFRATELWRVSKKALTPLFFS